MNLNLYVLIICLTVIIESYSGLMTPIKNYQAVTAYRDNNLDRSRTLFEDLIARNPQDHEALYNAGKVLYKQQSFDKAEHYFNEVTRLHNVPDQLQIQALFDRSNAQVRQNKLQEALAGYEEIVKRMPDHAQAQDMIEQIKKKLEEQKKQPPSQQQKDQQQQSQEQKDKQSNNQNKQDNKNKNKQDKEDSQQQSQSDSKSSENDQEKNNQEKSEQEKSSDQNKSEQQENKTDQQKDQGSDDPDQEFKHDNQQKQGKQQHGQQQESKKTEDQERANQEREHKQNQTGNEPQHNKSHDKENKDRQQAVDQQTSPHDARLNEEEQYILKLLEKEDAQTVKEMLKASLKKETGQSHGQKNW